MNVDTAIAGLGITEMGKVYGRTSADFAADAVRRAVDDAGLALTDLDGLLVNSGVGGGLGIDLAARLGLFDLPLLSAVNTFGSTASGMVQLASFAIAAGHTNAVACVFGDAPLREAVRTGEMYSGRGGPYRGLRGLSGIAGLSSAPSTYALAARRHMDAYGTNEDHFAAVAVAQRDWARDNPQAQMREPITVDDHHASRWVVGAAAAPRLLPGVERRASPSSSPPRNVPATSGSHPCTCGDGASAIPATRWNAGASGGCAPAPPSRGGPRIAARRRRAVRHRRGRALRLLHLHRDRVARGLRLLREG